MDVLDIKVDAQGYRALLKGSGVIIEDMKTPQGMIVYVKDNLIIYDENIKLPLKPMIGVIGVAPACEGIGTFYPGPHGGNMDNNVITSGTRVYLPVFVPGALLAIGDLHASMGDGELTGGGIDIDGEVTIRLGLLKGKSRPRPWLETKNSWATCSNAPTLEEAIAIATRDMVDLLIEKVGLTKEYTFMMIGSHGDAKIGQAAKIMGLDATVCLVFPKIVT